MAQEVESIAWQADVSLGGFNGRFGHIFLILETLRPRTRKMWLVARKCDNSWFPMVVSIEMNLLPHNPKLCCCKLEQSQWRFYGKMLTWGVFHKGGSVKRGLVWKLFLVWTRPTKPWSQSQPREQITVIHREETRGLQAAQIKHII